MANKSNREKMESFIEQAQNAQSINELLDISDAAFDFTHYLPDEAWSEIRELDGRLERVVYAKEFELEN